MALLSAPPCQVAERIAGEVCSLPIHPLLSDADIEVVSEAVSRWAPAE
jgi:dTDP-4-amino-4,6-dideoxygalactose transaminase